MSRFGNIANNSYRVFIVHLNILCWLLHFRSSIKPHDGQVPAFYLFIKYCFSLGRCCGRHVSIQERIVFFGRQILSGMHRSWTIPWCAVLVDLLVQKGIYSLTDLM